MDGADLTKALRFHIKKRRAALLESFLTTTDAEKVRGRVLELDEFANKLTELSKREDLSDDDIETD